MQTQGKKNPIKLAERNRKLSSVAAKAKLEKPKLVYDEGQGQRRFAEGIVNIHGVF